MFSITTSKRIYFMYAEKPEEMKDWVDSLGRAISKLSAGKPPVAVSTPPVTQ
jgi:hypothetical protein